jgi:hypothetical protein|tara:strand:- start:58 stop:1170 length:1113 start_codon:yes stop_codon:yes gene_type:complete
MDPNEKIQLDDITFDDVIAGDGVDTVAIDEIEKPVEEVKEEVKAEKPTDELEDIEDDVEKKSESNIEEDSKESDDTEIKDDEDVEKTDDEEGTIVSEVLEKLGYELDGEYPDTSEGLAEMTKDVASQMADNRIDEVMEAFPLVKEHLQYVLNGGQSQNFMQAHDPNLDYDKFELAENDIRSQKGILADYFTEKGHDQEFIKEMLNDYEDSGKLYSKAEQAKQALGKVQGQRREQMMAHQQETVKQQQAKQEEFWGEVADTIHESNEFAGLSVPEKEKAQFFDWLATPVTNEGLTQRDVDHSEANMDVRLAIDYLMYKGFNLQDIIQTKAKTQATKSLRQKISKNEENVKSARKRSRVSKNIDLDSLDLSI